MNEVLKMSQVEILFDEKSIRETAPSSYFIRISQDFTSGKTRSFPQPSLILTIAGIRRSMIRPSNVNNTTGDGADGLNSSLPSEKERV